MDYRISYQEAGFNPIISADFSAEKVNGYRYAFNGMERDDEVKGVGNGYTTHFRRYDSRIGMWLSTDPVVHPWLSPYNAFDGNPIAIADPSGADGESRARKYQKKHGGEIMVSKDDKGRQVWSVNSADVTIGENGMYNFEAHSKVFRDHLGDKIVAIPGKIDRFMKSNRALDRIDESLDGSRNGTGQPPTALKVVFGLNPAVSLYNGSHSVITGTDMYLDSVSRVMGAVEAGLFFLPGAGYVDDAGRVILKLARPLKVIDGPAILAMRKAQNAWPFERILGVDELMRASCDQDAIKIQEAIGGQIMTITHGHGGMSRLSEVLYNGSYDDFGWVYHKAVRVGDYVFDRLSGPGGMHIDDYKKLFKEVENLIFE